MTLRLLLVTAIVVAATVVGRWWRLRQGRVRPVVPDPATGPAPTGFTGEARDVVEPVMTVPSVVAATLVSTPTCRTCPQVRDALDAVADIAPAFHWDEVDATTDLEFVRDHGVRRAPTVLFHDADGQVVARAAGAMGPAQVAEAVGIDLALATG